MSVHIKRNKKGKIEVTHNNDILDHYLLLAIEDFWDSKFAGNRKNKADYVKRRKIYD